MEISLEDTQIKNQKLWNEVWGHHLGNKYPHEFLVRFIAFIRQKEYIPHLSALDIGFGCAANLKMCYEMGYEISGIEVSSRALEKTRKNFEEQNIPFTGKLFNSPLIPFENNIFSLVYSQQAIYYNLDLEKVLQEIYRVLKPAGAFYLSFFRPDHWYFKYSDKVKDNLVKWSNDFPTKALRGLTLRFFPSKESLYELFSSFKHVRVDDLSSNLLGVEQHLWVVTGFKAPEEGEVSEFNFLDHYQNIATIKEAN